MPQKILFDTLNYAKILTNGGVAYAEIHATALSEALDQNIYVKHEVDTMIEAALRRFDERTVQIREEMQKERLQIEQRFNQLHLDIKSVQIEMNKKMKEVQENILKRGYTALAIILAVNALSSSLLHFAR
jgi:DNA-binding ferritin-like protein